MRARLIDPTHPDPTTPAHTHVRIVAYVKGGDISEDPQECTCRHFPQQSVCEFAFGTETLLLSQVVQVRSSLCHYSTLY